MLIGSTWQYVNKSGGPDRRFKNNRQLPIVEYGRLTLGDGQHLDQVWEASNVAALQMLFGALNKAGVRS